VQFLGGELVGAGGGAGDDVGDAQAEGEELLLLVGPGMVRSLAAASSAGVGRARRPGAVTGPDSATRSR
jgi:hypothetical protein